MYTGRFDAKLSLGGYDSQLSPAGTGVLDDALAVCEVIAPKMAPMAIATC
ncbi:MAG: hypothetical protein AB4352_27130 [Hormoscilla sp.]